MKYCWFIPLFFLSIVAFGQTPMVIDPSDVELAAMNESPSVSHKVIFSPERLPLFPGGEKGLQDFAYEQWKLQKKNQKLMSGKTVLVSFTIDSMGNVIDIRRGLNKYDDEINVIAVGFIMVMPKWIPGGTGVFGAEGSSNSNVIMLADVSLGTYEGKAFSIPARITILPRPSLPVSDVPVYIAPDQRELYKLYGNVPDSLFADSIPRLPGSSIGSFLANNVKYPQLEKENNKQGTVYIEFVVEKDGSVTNAYAIQAVYGAPGLSKEAMRVMKILPKMQPGTVNGKPVRVRMTVPVRFVLM